MPVGLIAAALISGGMVQDASAQIAFIPPSITDKLDKAGEDVGKPAGADQGDRLNDLHTMTLTLPSTAGKKMAYLGACNRCDELGLVISSNGKRTGAERTGTSRPLVRAEGDAAGKANVTITMRGCEDEPCYFAVRAYETE